MKGPFFKASILQSSHIPQVDAHMHTNWTDGGSTFEEYALRAKELKLTSIAFTEHADDKSPWFADFIALQEHIRALAFPVKVYFGAEVKVGHTDGTLCMSEDRIQQLDFLMGVLHRYPDGNGGYHSFKELTAEDAQQIDFELSRALLANPYVDVWGHPGGVYVHHFGAYKEAWMRELISLGIRNKKIIEINTNMRYRSVLPVIYEECMLHDCIVSVGSDAHHIKELGGVCHVLADMQKNQEMRSTEA